jgi:hypothetical protein
VDNTISGQTILEAVAAGSIMCIAFAAFAIFKKERNKELGDGRCPRADQAWVSRSSWVDLTPQAGRRRAAGGVLQLAPI